MHALRSYLLVAIFVGFASTSLQANVIADSATVESPSGEIQRVLPSVTERVDDWRAFTPPSIVVEPEPGLPIKFDRVRCIANPDGSTTWIGRNGLPGASLVGVGTNDRWDAVLFVAGSQYDIHIHANTALVVATGTPAADGTSPIVRVISDRIFTPATDTIPALDESSYINRPMVAPRNAATLTSIRAINPPPNKVSVVDVIFFFSADAEQEAIAFAGSLANVPAYLNSTYRAYLESANLVLEQSGVPNLRWNFVGAFRVPDYTPTTQLFDDCVLFNYYIADANHHLATEVGQFAKATSTALFADQEVLIVGQRGFSAAIASCSGYQSTITLPAGYLTLAYTLASNFGINFERSFTNVAASDNSYNYGYKFVLPVTADNGQRQSSITFSDVMSYTTGQVTLPYYSNPDTKFIGTALQSSGWDANPKLYALGIPAGQPQAADAARVLREGAAAIASHRNSGGPTAPAILAQPTMRCTEIPAPLCFDVPASGGDLFYEWRMDGIDQFIRFPSLAIDKSVPDFAGIWNLTVSNSVGSATSAPFIVGFTSTIKIAGWGNLVGADIVHPNGNIFDQILLTRLGLTVTADPGKTTRVSFVDMSDDIIQVEFSGAGALTIRLTDYALDSGLHNFAKAQPPTKYNQPEIAYMKGRAGFVIIGADQTTNISVFSVGRSNAINQTLFKNDVIYDGMADIAYIAIASERGVFGSVRTGNARFSAASGMTGLYAPDVQFTGPVYLGNINATGTAIPVIRTGAAADVRVTGGDLAQANGMPVDVSGFTQLSFTAGTSSHGNYQPAKSNRAILVKDGHDVTAEIVVSP